MIEYFKEQIDMVRETTGIEQSIVYFIVYDENTGSEMLKLHTSELYKYVSCLKYIGSVGRIYPRFVIVDQNQFEQLKVDK